MTEKLETAYLAAGCFWGVEDCLRQLNGVVETRVGFMGGRTKNPTYKQVCTGTTGHAETVRVVFDPSIISYAQLLTYFFEIHDPTQVDRQGPDRGSQYRSAIFYLDRNQKQTSLKLIEQLKKRGLDVATELAKAGFFYEAEEYHQQYLSKRKGMAGGGCDFG